MRYFTDHFEYGIEEALSDEILTPGNCFDYVSSTFLNGFINHVKPLSCYIVHRYQAVDEEVPEVSLREGPPESPWVKWTGTKRALYEKVVNRPELVYHADLHMFYDDILLLGKLGRQYWYFWFDCDVSDCCLGRFETEDSEEEVIEVFKKHVYERAADLKYQKEYNDPWEIPAKNLERWGWLSF